MQYCQFQVLLGCTLTNAHLAWCTGSLGPRPDWDPDIVEALENAEVSSELDQQLEDDFVLLVSSSSSACVCLLIMRAFYSFVTLQG